MKQVYKNGTWQKGAAGPENIREDLRKLPGELVTKEDDDGDKVHELDPEHVKDTIIADYKKAIAEAESPTPQHETQADKREKRRRLCRPGKYVDFRDVGKEAAQYEVDLHRLSAMAGIITGELNLLSRGAPLSHDVYRARHIWFPTRNLNHYQLRMGNPPPRSQRPSYLRGLDLVVDILEPGERLRDMARGAGLDLFSLQEAQAAMAVEDAEQEERMVLLPEELR